MSATEIAGITCTVLAFLIGTFFGHRNFLEIARQRNNLLELLKTVYVHEGTDPDIQRMIWRHFVRFDWSTVPLTGKEANE